MKKIDKNFWKNSKVLVTGHSGFKGFWLCNYLKLLQSKVYGISLEKNKELNYKNIIEKEFFFNIKNKNKLERVINKVKPKFIFHFAAQPLVSESYKDPGTTYISNLIGTSNILQICKDKKNIKSILIITSDKCYKIKNTLYPFKENDELSGDDPYSASKACQEIISWSYAKSFFHKKKNYNIATCRAGNIIGGGDFSKNRLLPDIMLTLFKKKNLLIRNITYLRPWQHVVEPITGYIILAQKLSSNKKKFSEAFNFGPNKKNIVAVGNILNHMKKINPLIKWKKLNKTSFHESKYLSLNINKSKKILNFYPNLNIFDGLRLTYDWYFQFYKKKVDPKKITQIQIKYFLNKYYGKM